MDLTGYLPDDLLCKVDTASMAVALEVRCPYLDRDLARRVLSAPLDTLIPGRRRKALLRAIARKYLPAAVVTGRASFRSHNGARQSDGLGRTARIILRSLKGPTDNRLSHP